MQIVTWLKKKEEKAAQSCRINSWWDTEVGETHTPKIRGLNLISPVAIVACWLWAIQQWLLLGIWREAGLTVKTFNDDYVKFLELA